MLEGGRNPAEPDDSTATGSAVVSVFVPARRRKGLAIFDN
jgi:hypothetical protein